MENPGMRIKLPVKRVLALQRLVTALDTVQAMVGPVSRGATFRRRLAKQTDQELERFLRAAKRRVMVLKPLQRAPIDVELETEMGSTNLKGGHNG
jgi:hypothetical protein